MSKGNKVVSFWSGHDCSFCVLEDGKPKIHAEYERYIREKEPKGDSVKFFFDVCGEEELDGVTDIAFCHPESNVLAYKESLDKLMSLCEDKGIKFHITGHHFAHATHAFYSSKFDKSLIFTIDGGGVEFESDNGRVETATAFFVGNSEGVEEAKLLPMNLVNIGGLWTRATRYIFKLQSGWPHGHQAGTVMAMSSFGDSSKYFEDFKKMLTTDIAQASFKPPTQPKGAYDGNDPIHPYLDKWTKLAEVSEQERFDLAAGLQSATEFLIRGLVSDFSKSYPDYKNLCLCGGVALNSVFTGKVVEWDDNNIENVYIPPCPHDGGLPIGAAQHVWHSILGNDRVDWKDNVSPYLGELYDEKSIRDTIGEYGDELAVSSCNDNDVVDFLNDQKIVSVFRGGSESGRRALGNRSILADPRSDKMKDMINEKVKHRQWFRPFAPSIMREHVSEWFVKDVDSPYMSFVLKIRKDKLYLIPAVAHYDETARLQTVTENDNPWYHSLLSKWNEKSGVPIFLNTSFNDREPICETPEHAISCFLRTDIDYLYFADFGILLFKKELP